MKEAVFRKDKDGDWSFVVTDDDECDLTVRIGKSENRSWFCEVTYDTWNVLDDDLGSEKVLGFSFTTGRHPASDIVAKGKHEVERLHKFHKVGVAGEVLRARWIFPRDRH